MGTWMRFGERAAVLALAVTLLACQGAPQARTPTRPETADPEMAAAVNREVAAFRSTNPADWEEAKRRLLAMGEPAIPYITAEFRKGDALTATLCRDVLVTEGALAVPALLEALGDSHPRARSAAAVALGRIRDERAVEPLVRVLRGDRAPVVRAAAARSLGEIGDITASPALVDGVGDRDEQVRSHCVRSLRQFSGKPYGTDQDLWRKWWNSAKPKS
ncbi:MAG: HEAT repeat domain-containing protein [Planctomycetota bacterium]